MGYKLADVIWNDDGTMANKGYIAEYEGIPIDANINNKLKAFDIIKEKQVNVYRFYFVQAYKNPFERYNDTLFVTEKNFLTQEEYDLLKETLL